MRYPWTQRRKGLFGLVQPFVRIIQGQAQHGIQQRHAHLFKLPDNLRCHTSGFRIHTGRAPGGLVHAENHGRDVVLQRELDISRHKFGTFSLC